MSALFQQLTQVVPNVHLRRFLILIVALAALEIGTGFISYFVSSDEEGSSSSRSFSSKRGSQDEIASDDPDPDAVPFPPHASSRYLTQIPSEEFVAELLIQAPPDEDVYNVIKVERAAGGQPIVVVYIDPGRQVLMRLPPSKYRIKLARGKNWLGDKELFGSETRAYRTNIIDLSPRRDGAKATATVSLQGFVDGTTRGGIGIRKQQF